ncbi:hypothetical protein [Dyadobacter pollutisoli]|jgi:hypothetical protein|uniref:Uncharacterized protein n=1 Tax=Dyadobacter pollutisoli TaxID=2910158 RepID=A0A9E8SJ33_9BACT|nr:hypothetical protein [Dyadobacter pollutisoli]WAC10905.1 hypothetical protein ON006_24555 [Dyadobacter pollutisoli]
MKVILDIQDNKAAFVMGLLQRLPFVKTKPLSPYQAKVPDDVKEAVGEMHQIKKGSLQARDAEAIFSY